MSTNGTENLVSLFGRVTRDAKAYELGDNKMATRFTVATSESWKSGNEWVEKAQFHPCVVFNGLAERAAENFRQGDKVRIIGALEHREYEKDGQKKNISEVVIRGPQHSAMMVAKYEPKPG